MGPAWPGVNRARLGPGIGVNPGRGMSLRIGARQGMELKWN